MVQDTTSDAGKSTLVTGLCRVLRRRGVRVAPFKPQNMALNSAVAADGGAFAHVAGTLALPATGERERVTGCIINRFRGERALLDPGLRWLEQHTRKPVFGVLPYLTGLALDAEDAIPRLPSTPTEADSPRLRLIVPVLPRISNHTDFEALRAHPHVPLQCIGPDQIPPPADVVIFPGSKSVRTDLAWLRSQGWDRYLQRHLHYGGKLMGICGGFHMLGRCISDPSGLEGPSGASAGFDTVLQPRKQLRNACGRLAFEDTPVGGCEIHAGVSAGPALRSRAMFLDDGRMDGALSADAIERHLDLAALLAPLEAVREGGSSGLPAAVAPGNRGGGIVRMRCKP